VPGATTSCGPPAPAGPRLGSYQRREPENTLLHRVVREHWKTFLAEVAARTDGSTLPGHVTAEFERYLRCGILAHGFARVRCTACGDELLVAFSCKGRGFCPSCATRRMQGTATHLIDHVIPHVPVRQWVLSLPQWARFLLARDPALITRALQIFLAEVFKSHRRRARAEGAVEPVCGAVTMVQRFGSALNLNVHFHSIVVDGVFVRMDDGAVRFLALPAPSDEVLKEVLRRVEARLTKLLRPLRRASEDDARPLDALGYAQAESITGLGLRRGAVRQPKKHAALLNGFSLHNGVHLHANDREGLAHLCGYGARPALSQQRLSLQDDGSLLLRFKRQLHDGRTGLTLAPTELLRRLAALVPPPRAHLVRFHGVFGPASSWRAAVVAGAAADPSQAPSTPALPAAPESATSPDSPPSKPRRPDAQIPWATLLLRIFKEDVLACPCGGRRKVTAFIEERKTIEAILGHLGLPTTGPPLAPARGGEGAEEGWRDEVPVLEQALR
jgi:hypothetical protein